MIAWFRFSAVILFSLALRDAVAFTPFQWLGIFGGIALGVIGNRAIVYLRRRWRSYRSTGIKIDTGATNIFGQHETGRRRPRWRHE